MTPNDKIKGKDGSLGSLIEKIRNLIKAYLPKKNYNQDLKDVLDELTECTKRFDSTDISKFVKEGISPEEADKYDKRFNSTNISEFVKEGISPEIANKYDERFYGFDIISLRKKNIGPVDANKYEKRFDRDEIVYLNNMKVSPEEVKKYDKRFDEKGIAALCRQNVSPEEANKYDKRFNGEEIAFLKEDDVEPEDARKYDSRFNGKGIAALYRQNVSPEEANKYDKRFNGEEIASFREKDIWTNISPEKANKYDKRFSASDIVTLREHYVGPDDASKYDKRFSAWDIAFLKGYVSPEEAFKYDERFGGDDITTFKNKNISPEEANKYDRRFNLEDILLLRKCKVPPEVFSSFSDDKRETISKFFRKILSCIKRGGDYSLFNTGGCSVLFFQKENENVWKFSKKIEEEANLLRLLKEPKNVIQIKGDVKEGVAVGLEYIKGDSLENIIKKQPAMQSEKILKYSAGIMNGLIEMRKAGIYYHRDIRPGNIIIDEENDRAVICDLGIATTDKHALAKDNRRYGGKNDLISLGQVMYKMATGNHLFAESPEMERTIYAEKIRDYREKVYSEPALLEKHLERVDKTVENEEVRTLIKSCLTAKNYDYGKMQKMFARLK